MIDVILPVLNEAGALAWVLPRMPEGYRAIVVDNGSSDGSADIALNLGADVVTEPRRGFGAACWAGLNTATSDLVAFMDADASLDPRELPQVCDPVMLGDADLVLGARSVQSGSWPRHAQLANRYLAHQVQRRTGVALSDLGPMRAARRGPLLALDLQDRGFAWPLEMVLKAATAGWLVRECPVSYRPRIGRSKVTGTVRGTARAARDMSRLLRDTRGAQ
jgi:glycosyltransferase involved in cell wall biosynthesis